MLLVQSTPELQSFGGIFLGQDVFPSIEDIGAIPLPVLKNAWCHIGEVGNPERQQGSENREKSEKGQTDLEEQVII